MGIVLQRVSQCSVAVDAQVVGSIGIGLLLLLGVTPGDDANDIAHLCEKVIHLRVFPDAEGKMNLSVLDVSGELLVVSQFTLYGDCRKGRRPSFEKAAPAEDAKRLYVAFTDKLRESGLRVETGVFQADMEVSLVNKGPVTLILDSKVR